MLTVIFRGSFWFNSLPLLLRKLCSPVVNKDLRCHEICSDKRFTVTTLKKKKPRLSALYDLMGILPFKWLMRPSWHLGLPPDTGHQGTFWFTGIAVGPGTADSGASNRGLGCTLLHHAGFGKCLCLSNLETWGAPR